MPAHLPVLLALGLVELTFLTLLGWWPGTPMPHPGLLLYGGAFLAWAAAGFLTSPRRPPPPAWLVWALALAFRLILIPLTPELSDDVYRYLWDGHVQIQGVNPYLHAPSDPALESLRTAWHGLVNNPDVPTIYPPLAQAAFFLIALLGGGILQAKILWLGMDLLGGWVLSRIARNTGREPRSILLLYLWCPLLVVETAWSAHMEVLGLLGLSVLVLSGGNPVRAGVAGAAATLVKFAPVAALPPLARRLGARFLLAFAGTTLLLHLPYLSAGDALWSGLFTYVRDWRFMVGPFALLETVLPGRWPPRVAAAALVGGVVALATVRSFSVERSLFWILGAGILLSPTVHPWYVLWILPFAALRRSGPWLLLQGLAFLGYWGLGTFQDTGVWPQPLWIRLLVWVPPAAWILIEGARLVVAPAVGEQAGQPQGQPTGSEEE